MTSQFRNRLIAGVLTCLVGLSSPLNSEAEDKRTILLRQAGKPDRKCVIESSTPLPDGTMRHLVRDVDSGDIMTVIDRRQLKNGSKNTSPSEIVPATISSPSPEPTPKPTTDRTLNVVRRKVEPKPLMQPNKVDPLFPEGVEPPKPLTHTTNKPLLPSPNPVAPEPVVTKPVVTKPVATKPTPDAEPKKQQDEGLLTRLFGSDQKPQPKTPVKATPKPEPKKQQDEGLLTRLFGSDQKPQPKAPVTTTPKSEPKPQATTSTRPVVSVPAKAVDPQIATLKHALRPSQREGAAVALVSRPDMSIEAIAALVEAAQLDPAATVRACCIKCLAARKLADPAFIAALPMLSEDPDELVREEAIVAIEILGAN